MAVTHSTFIAKYPEFAAISESYFGIWKTATALELNSTTWGTLYDEALECLIGHYLKRFPETSGAAADARGPVTSMATGGMSTSFAYLGASESGDRAALMATAYGQRFLRLQRGRIIPMLVGG